MHDPWARTKWGIAGGNGGCSVEESKGEKLGQL